MIRLLVLLILLQLCCTAPKNDRSNHLSYENVLLIISDDLANHAVGCYGNDIIQTPNLDRLATKGVRFERAYANSPMCTPSRASFITGLYPHATGTTLLFSPLPDSAYTLAEHLKRFDFKTGIFGKTHFQSTLRHGFDTIVLNRHHKEYLLEQSIKNDSVVPIRPPWKPFRDHARQWLNAEGATSGVKAEYSQGTFFANAAVQFMADNKADRFLAIASFNEPHSPFNFPIEYFNTINPRDIILPEAASQDSIWIPNVFRDLTEQERRGIVRSYYQSVEYMDSNIGLLMKSLDSLGIMDKTLVIVYGDHGYLLNHHGRFEKHMMWEESIKTPLIIKGFQPGITLSQPVSLVDIAPTVLELLGITPMPVCHGKSLVPLLTGQTSLHKSTIFAEYTTDNKAMIVLDQWKYIFSTGERDLGSGYATGHGAIGIMHRLYHLIDDPFEKQNIAVNNPKQVKLLQTKMLNHFRKSHPLRHQVSVDSNMVYQLSQFCQPVEKNVDHSTK